MARSVEFPDLREMDIGGGELETDDCAIVTTPGAVWREGFHVEGDAVDDVHRVECDALGNGLVGCVIGRVTGRTPADDTARAAHPRRGDGRGREVTFPIATRVTEIDRGTGFVRGEGRDGGNARARLTGIRRRPRGGLGGQRCVERAGGALVGEETVVGLQEGVELARAPGGQDGDGGGSSRGFCGDG